MAWEVWARVLLALQLCSIFLGKSHNNCITAVPATAADKQLHDRAAAAAAQHYIALVTLLRVAGCSCCRPLLLLLLTVQLPMLCNSLLLPLFLLNTCWYCCCCRQFMPLLWLLPTCCCLLDLPVYCVLLQVRVVLLQLKALWCIPAVLHPPQQHMHKQKPHIQ